MAEMREILVEEKGPVALLTLNRPRDLNRLRRATLEELEGVLRALAGRPGVRALVITGQGKAFTAGVALEEIRGLTAEQAGAFARFGQRIYSFLEGMDAVSIAALNGFTFGGGTELALACDIRIASDRARIGSPEVTLGMMPGFGATQRLPRIVGLGLAKELILSGEVIDAERALAIGLVNRVVPADQLLAVAHGLAQRIASNAPLAVRLAKRGVRRAALADLEAGLEYEAATFAESFRTREPEEGIAAFQEKRLPRWDDERSAS